MTRPFRREESIRAEQFTWALIPHFLRGRGFEVTRHEVKQRGLNLHVVSPAGETLTMRARLCWREDDIRGEAPFAAAQLLASITDGDWEGSLHAKAERYTKMGISHLLLVQREHDRIIRAALIGVSDVMPIWADQRRIYATLIREGRLGNRKANPAENGRSPTLYLSDDGAPDVTAFMDHHPHIVDLTLLEPTTIKAAGHGAGFGDPIRNARVERAAVEEVTRRYRKSGWDVVSVESEGVGYDLDCHRSGVTHHVEVKGVSGREPRFHLTVGELRRAEDDPEFLLVVVTEALIDSPVVTTFSGHEFLNHFTVSPTQFRAALRSQ